MDSPLLFSILGFGAMLLSLTVHEFSHAMAGYLMGDETARRAGRLTLNPAAHIDPVGTLLIPIIGALTGIPIFGWAKPVPFNPYNLKYPKWGPTLVAFAGPGSNFVAAFLYLFLLKFCIAVVGLTQANLLVLFLVILVWVNISLGVFNLIPVPPLDGSGILSVVLDKPQHTEVKRFLMFRGPMILFAIVILDSISSKSFLGAAFGAVARWAFGIVGLNGAL